MALLNRTSPVSESLTFTSISFGIRGSLSVNVCSSSHISTGSERRIVWPFSVSSTMTVLG